MLAAHLLLLFAAGTGSDALPRTGNGLARQMSAACGLKLRVDPALSRAAARHAGLHLRGEAPSPESTLRTEGLGDPEVWPVVSVGPTPQSLWQDSLGRCPEPSFGATHVGAAWADLGGRWAAVLLYTRRLVEWGRAAWSEGFEVTGRAMADVEPDRVAWLRGCTPDLRCDGVGEKPLDSGLFVSLSAADVVEVLGTSKAGPVVLGLWRRPSLTPSLSLPPEPNAAWRALRRTRGLPAGRSQSSLARAAQQHAKKVCAEGRAFHVGPGGVGPDDRAARAGYPGPVAENIAVARSLERALGNLLLSPSHHATQVEPSIRAYGFGRARRGGRTCFVQLFGYR